MDARGKTICLPTLKGGDITNKKTEKNIATEVIDSQEPGLSSRRKEWLTFYLSDTEDSRSEDDNALCVICKRLLYINYKIIE